MLKGQKRRKENRWRSSNRNISARRRILKNRRIKTRIKEEESRSWPSTSGRLLSKLRKLRRKYWLKQIYSSMTLFMAETASASHP